MLIQDREKPIVVMPFQQVGQFVNDDVFEALHRLFREFEIEPDSAGGGVAGAPFGFHPLDAPVGDMHSQDGLPLLHERGD